MEGLGALTVTYDGGTLQTTAVCKLNMGYFFLCLKFGFNTFLWKAFAFLVLT